MTKHGQPTSVVCAGITEKGGVGVIVLSVFTYLLLPCGGLLTAELFLSQAQELSQHLPFLTALGSNAPSLHLSPSGLAQSLGHLFPCCPLSLTTAGHCDWQDTVEMLWDDFQDSATKVTVAFRLLAFSGFCTLGEGSHMSKEHWNNLWRGNQKDSEASPQGPGFILELNLPTLAEFQRATCLAAISNAVFLRDLKPEPKPSSS